MTVLQFQMDDTKIERIQEHEIKCNLGPLVYGRSGGTEYVLCSERKP